MLRDMTYIKNSYISIRGIAAGDFSCILVSPDHDKLPLSLQEHSWRFIRHYPDFLQGEKFALSGPVLPPLARNKKVTFYLAR